MDSGTMFFILGLLGCTTAYTIWDHIVIDRLRRQLVDMQYKLIKVESNTVKLKKDLFELNLMLTKGPSVGVEIHSERRTHDQSRKEHR